MMYGMNIMSQVAIPVFFYNFRTISSTNQNGGRTYFGVGVVTTFFLFFLVGWD
jgi:hypothetical protein